MSVRMAIVKLSAVVAGGALIGGGAVHMAEKAATGKAQYVKHAKAPAKAPAHHHIKAPVRAKAKEVVSTECKTTKCQPHEELAVVPLPAPAVPAMQAPPEVQQVPETEDYHAFGGPYSSGVYVPQGRHVIIRERIPVPGPTPVPAPPMLILFGMAAAAIFGRRHLGAGLA